MPLQIPNLDDRNFTDMVKEARSMIPQYAPEWTNHNASDPGITLVELLAYVSEILIYRLNRVTRESRIKFLQLLRQVAPAEKAWLADPDTSLAEVDEELRRTVLGLRQLQRAVTAQDFEILVKKLPIPSDQPKIVRSRCFSGMNLANPQTEASRLDNPGHISVVIVPEGELDPEKSASLLARVRNELEPMRLLTTRLHIVQPFYLHLSLGAQIRIQPGAEFNEVRTAAIDKLHQYFNPLPDDSSNREGWPFGRSIYLSEIYAQLEEVNGVDYVREARALHLSDKSESLGSEHSAVGVQIGIPAASKVGVNTRLGGEAPGDLERLMRDARGALIAVLLRPYELVKIEVREDNLVFADT